MKYTKTINLDVNKPFYEVLHAKQNDNARYLLFNLLNNGVPFALTDKTVRAYAIKPDNTKVYNDLTIINAINGQAELQLTSQMLAVPGMINVELVIFEGTDILSTVKFVIEVTGNLRNDAAIESTNEFSALVNALANIDNLEVNYAPRLTSVESSLSDIATLKPNGIDDTFNIQNELNTKGICNLGLGVYICTKLTLGADMKLIGQGIGRTTIKLKDNTNTTLLYLHNAYECSVEKLKLDGNKANNTSPINEDVSLIHVENELGYTPSNLYMVLNKLTLINGCHNGLYLKVPNRTAYSWVYNIDNIFILECEGYGFRDETTDNCFSNFYISGCKLADILLYYCSSNKYVNFKCDNGGIINSGETSQTDGANIIMVHVGLCQFTNFDSQSSYYVGVKMFSCADNIFNAWISDNGMHWISNDINSLGIGIAIYDSYNINGTLIFSDNMKRQTTDLYISSSVSADISFNSSSFTPTKIKNNGTRCNITSLEYLIRRTLIPTQSPLTLYVDISTGLDTNDGLSVLTPLRTINKAITLIPQVVNHSIIINVASGVYGEYLTISGYHGKGNITIKGATSISNSANFSLDVISIYNSSIPITIIGFNATNIDKPFIVASANITLSDCMSVSSGSKGVVISKSIAFLYACQFSNKSVAIDCSMMTTLKSSSCNNSINNTIGLLSSSSTIMKEGTQPIATTLESVNGGGVIR